MNETICKATVQNDRLADTNLVEAYLLSAERALYYLFISNLQVSDLSLAAAFFLEYGHHKLCPLCFFSALICREISSVNQSAVKIKALLSFSYYPVHKNFVVTLQLNTIWLPVVNKFISRLRFYLVSVGLFFP